MRKTFISASSPKATDELDCSPEKSVECVSMSRSWPGRRWNISSPRVSAGSRAGGGRRASVSAAMTGANDAGRVLVEEDEDEAAAAILAPQAS